MPDKPKRRFNLPLSTLLREGDKLLAALNDADYVAPMKARLGEDIASVQNNHLVTARDKAGLQSGKAAQAGNLTREQNTALHDLTRLMAGARRSATLAFRGQTVLLHEEFKVGDVEPQTLDADLERARIIAASCTTHAAALAKEGWINADTLALGNAIETLGGKDLNQEAAIVDRIELTADVVRAANALYESCLRIQNGARLQWPLPAPGLEIPEGTVAARGRFLLDTFPPRDRSQPDGGTGGGGTTPPTPPSN